MRLAETIIEDTVERLCITTDISEEEFLYCTTIELGGFQTAMNFDNLIELAEICIKHCKAIKNYNKSKEDSL